MKLCPLIEYEVRTRLWKNHAEYVHQKLVPDPFFYFRKQPKTAMACKKFF